MRDYYLQPLQDGEIVSKEELYKYYIEQNCTYNDCCKLFNVGRTKLKVMLKYYGITKPKNLQVAAAQNTFLKQYGVTHPRKNKEKNAEMIEKTKKTCREKYGVDFVGQVQEFKDKSAETYKQTYKEHGDEIRAKIRQTCLERYGNENVSQTDEWKEKHRRTNMERYGVECTFQLQEVKEKIKQTNIERYGVENVAQSEEVKNKVKQTCLKKYGTDSYMKTEEFRERGKQTMMEKYGVENYCYAEDFKDKVKQTCQEKYGVDYASQSPEFRERVAKTNLERYGHTCNLASPDGIKKKTETWLKHLGVDHPSKCPAVVEKQWESKKRNGHAASSKGEEFIKGKLLEKFHNVKFNYKETRYPFHCDFYLPDFDIFIEYQGFEGHGEHPFDYNNPDDIAKLLFWAERADRKKLDKRNKYLAYVHTWVERDPMKRECARKNKLKWFEFFTLEDFMKWYDTF